MPIVQLKRIMKLFVIFTLCIACFIHSLAGLKCYTCDDIQPNLSTNCSSGPVVEVCEEQYSSFCAIAYNYRDQGPYYNCGEQENCREQGCTGTNYCKEEGTFEVEGMLYGKFTIECCEGDLCNSFSSAHICKANLLCYISYLCLFLFVS